MRSRHAKRLLEGTAKGRSSATRAQHALERHIGLRASKRVPLEPSWNEQMDFSEDGP